MDEIKLDDDSLIKAIDDLIKSVHDIFQQLLLLDTQSMVWPLNQLLDRWLNFTNQTVKDPSILMHAQMTYWQDYLLLCQELQWKLANHATLSQSSNHFFPDENKQKIVLGFIEKFHFLMTQHLILIIKNIFSDDEADSPKMASYHNYINEAFSLADFFKECPPIFRTTSTAE
jgi:hypothetical protein